MARLRTAKVKASGKKTGGRGRAGAGTGKKKGKPVARRRAAGAARATRDDVDEALVEATVAMLVAHDRTTAGSKRRIGAHLLDSYFGGDEALARSRDSNKAKSFARLAERAVEDTLWDERDLREAVTIEIAARSLPEQVANGIDPTYLLMLASVDDREQRVALGTRVASGELRGAAAKDAIREASGKRLGGRKAQPPPVRGANELDRDGERMESEGRFEADELGKLDREQLRRVHEGLLRHQSRVAAFVRAAAVALEKAPERASEAEAN